MIRVPPRLPVFVALSLALGMGAARAADMPHRTAVWIRPPENGAALEQTLVAARQAGFTDVLLEGFYHGRAIWASDVAPMKLSYDALAVASSVAAREGLTLNVWFETLYWRPAERFGIPVTPLWRDAAATLSSRGEPSLAVSALGFVDPADAESGDTLAALTAELGRQYPAVGLHLDYLRYPRETDFGYHPAALAAFQAQSGLDARQLVRGTPEWQRWVDFRQGQITALAGRLIASYRAAGGRGLVSAAVFGGSDPLQNWRAWPGLQAAMPMLYFPVAALYRLLPLQFAPGDSLWPGIRVGPGGAALQPQLELLHRLGYPNVAVFGWTPGAAPGLARGH